VRVLSRLFRRLFLDKIAAAHKAGELVFFGDHAKLADAKAFTAYLAPLRTREWVVYSKRPAMLRALSRFTKGFVANAGHAPAGQRGAYRRPATGARPVYSREQIKKFYDERRAGRIPDSKWAAIEADIVAAANEGRVDSVFDKYGNETRLR
jgi:hypothetical protein